MSEYKRPKYSMKSLMNAAGRIRWAMYEYENYENQIKNPKSEDGLFEDDNEIERFWLKNQKRGQWGN